jgi:poly(3-hydroxybutyrate) depolymerase
MKSLLLLSFVLFDLALSSWAQTKPAPAAPSKQSPAEEQDIPGLRSFALSLAGVNREFVIYRPAELDAATKTPVVFAFHGTGGNGEDFLFDSGWQTIADREGITLVCGSALRYHIFEKSQEHQGEVLEEVRSFTTKWNDFSLPAQLDPQFSQQKLSDDVKFVQLMVAFVKKNYAVDETRFYATGFASGGEFTTRLSLQLADTFAAFATTGSINAITAEHIATANQYAPFKPRPFAQIIGETDSKLLHRAALEAFPLDESAVAPAAWLNKNTIKNSLAYLRLKDECKFQRLSGAASYRYHTPTEAGATHEFDLLIVEGMGHVYPNGGKQGFQVAEVFWNFMKRYRQ